MVAYKCPTSKTKQIKLHNGVLALSQMTLQKIVTVISIGAHKHKFISTTEMAKKTILTHIPKKAAHWVFLISVGMLNFVNANVDNLLISSFRQASSFIHRNGVSLQIRTAQSDIWQTCIQENILRQNTHFPFAVATPDCAVITPDCRCYNWVIAETAHVFQIGQCVYIRIPPTDINITLTWNLVYTYPYLPPGYESALYLFYRRLYSRHLDQTTYKAIATPLFCEALRADSIVRLWNVDLYATQQHTLNITFLPLDSSNSKNVPAVGPPFLLGVITFTVLFYLAYFQITPLYQTQCLPPQYQR